MVLNPEVQACGGTNIVNTDPVCFPCNNVTRMNKMKNYSDNRELSKILTWININGFILDSIRYTASVLVRTFPIDEDSIRHPKFFTRVKYTP